MNACVDRRTQEFTGLRVLVLVTEHEDKQGTNLVYVQPSSLIVVEDNPPLRSAAEALDTKLADLIASAVCP
jgi:hypothetical protein